MTYYSDVEITIQMLRMMRSGNYKSVKKLRADLKEDVPDLADEQIDRCLGMVKKSLEKWQ